MNVEKWMPILISIVIATVSITWITTMARCTIEQERIQAYCMEKGSTKEECIKIINPMMR